VNTWLPEVPSYAGWFLPDDQPILLVVEGDEIVEPQTYLRRMGFDRVEGYLAGGMLSWHTAGMETDSVATIAVQELCRRLDETGMQWILDVRSDTELEREGEIPGAQHIHITQLPLRLGEVPRDRTVYIICGTDLRSMMGASLLCRAGWNDLVVVLGGMAGWRSVSCPLRKRTRE
jgi:hydroxyacylglutathione hydrolase